MGIRVRNAGMLIGDNCAVLIDVVGKSRRQRGEIMLKRSKAVFGEEAASAGPSTALVGALGRACTFKPEQT